MAGECPLEQTLEILHITLPRLSNGRMDWSCDNLGLYGLCVEPGEKLAALTELVYEARVPYVFEDCIIQVSFFNWSRIGHLELRGHRTYHFVESLIGQTLRLETLIIDFFCGGGCTNIGWTYPMIWSLVFVD